MDIFLYWGIKLAVIVYRVDFKISWPSPCYFIPASLLCDMIKEAFTFVRKDA